MIPDVEDGELLFWDDDGEDKWEALQDLKMYDSDYMNKVQKDGKAPADFIYDSLGKE